MRGVRDPARRPARSRPRASRSASPATCRAAPSARVVRTVPWPGARRRSMRIKYGGERRLADPLGAAIAAPLATRRGRRRRGRAPVPSMRSRAKQPRLRPGRADRRVGGPPPRTRARRRPRADAGDDRPVRPRSTAPRRQRGRCVRGRRDRLAGRIEGRWVLLIDDVVTTGSSLAAGARALEAAGAAAVSAVTVARER